MAKLFNEYNRQYQVFRAIYRDSSVRLEPNINSRWSPEEIVVLERLFGIRGLKMLDIKHHQAGDVQDPEKKDVRKEYTKK
jgi:hypothetical protein